MASSPSEDRPTILNVEGNPETRQALSHILTEQGYAVEEASCGSDAIEKGAPRSSPDANRPDTRSPEIIPKITPDIILVGAQLPDMSGKQLAEKLQANPRCTSLIAVRDSAANGDAEGLRLVLAPLLRARKAEADLSEIRKEAQSLHRALRQSQEDLEKFTLRAAHDLEETFRAVTTFVQLIAETKDQQLSENQQTYQEHVLSSAARMRRLLQYMLSYSRISREDSVPCSSLNLSAAVIGARHSVGKTLKETAAEVNVEGPLPAVRGHLSQLQEMLTVVLKNALQYRRAEAAPRITVKAARHSETEWLVSVADNGIGIPAGYRESVFEPFKRLHGRELPGSGMGLALARKIVELHGGRIWIESSMGEGTTVFFTLPAAEEVESRA